MGVRGKEQGGGKSVDERFIYLENGVDILENIH